MIMTTQSGTQIVLLITFSQISSTRINKLAFKRHFQHIHLTFRIIYTHHSTSISPFINKRLNIFLKIIWLLTHRKIHYYANNTQNISTAQIILSASPRSTCHLYMLAAQPQWYQRRDETTGTHWDDSLHFYLFSDCIKIEKNTTLPDFFHINICLYIYIIAT